MVLADDALHGRAAGRTSLAIASVDGHLWMEGGDLLGEAVASLFAQPPRPFVEYLAGGFEEPRDLVGV